MNTPTFDRLVDAAYDAWKADEKKSYDDLVFDLPADQRAALLISDLDSQVQNGGFAQWIGNGYAEHSQDVRRVLARIGTHNAWNVENLVLIACQMDRERGRDLDSRDLDKQDEAYYRMRDQFMADVEAYFAGLA